MTPAAAKQRWLEMSPEERLAMAATVPRVAHTWREYSDEWVRWHLDGKDGSRVVKSGDVYTFSLGVDLVELGPYDSLAEAQAACDAELIRQGYVLESES